jgi:hypothetical protein
MMTTSDPDPSPPLADQPIPKAKVSKSGLKAVPGYNHGYRYRGPELTEISTAAICRFLDQAWKHASCSISTLAKLNGWWATSLVIAEHKLDKKQVWLLAYAEFKWWEALERQWNEFEALPDKDRLVIMRMREIRLRKESKAVNAEAGLVAAGLVKDPNAVHVLKPSVKKEKIGVEAGRQKGDERNVGFGGGDVASVSCVGRVAEQGKENDEDDGLTSDSDEDEDD